MLSVKSQLLGNFKSSKEYRHAFVEEKVRTQLAIQVKAIREQRGIGRPEFASLMKKAPSWVFRLEDPNQPPPTISTLLRVAEAFDTDLEISFSSFSGLLNRLERLAPESFEVPSFGEEVREGAFDRSMSHEEQAQILEELGRSSAGSSFRLYLGAQESGASRYFPMDPLTSNDGVRMRARRSTKPKRRQYLQ